GEVREAEDAREARPRLRPRGDVAEREQQARRSAPDPGDGQASRGAEDIVDQSAHEERPIAPLERALAAAQHDHLSGAHPLPPTTHATPVRRRMTERLAEALAPALAA